MYAEISLPPRPFLSALLQSQWSQDFYLKSSKPLCLYLEISKHLQPFPLSVLYVSFPQGFRELQRNGSAIKSTCVLVRFSIALIKRHNCRPLWEGRGYFILQLVVQHPRKSGQKFQAGTKVEAMEGSRLQLALGGLLSLLSYSTQDHQPRSSTAHSKVGTPALSIKKMHARLAHSSVSGGIVSIRVTLPK